MAVPRRPTGRLSGRHDDPGQGSPGQEGPGQEGPDQDGPGPRGPDPRRPDPDGFSPQRPDQGGSGPGGPGPQRSDQDGRGRRRRWRGPAVLGILAVLGVAIGVRLVGLGWGLPYTDLHPDEPLLLERAEHVHWGHLNPHFYIYPTFFIYQEALVLGASRALGATLPLGGAPTPGGELAAGLYAARGLSALWSLVTLMALYGLGCRLGGRRREPRDRPDEPDRPARREGRHDWRLGLLAAGLYAVHGASVLHAHYAVTDTAMTALATVTLWLAVRAWQERSATGVLLAAAAAGLAVSTKYSAASVVYVPLVAAFALAARQRLPLVRSALLALAVPATALVAFVAASPYVLLDHQVFFRDLIVESELQATARAGWHVEPLTRVSWTDLGLVENLGALLRDVGPFGLLLALLALGTVIVAFLRRGLVESAGGDAANGDAGSRWAPAPGEPGAWRRRLADPVPSGSRLIAWAIVAAWPVLFYLQMAPSTIGGQRYMLPIYPALLLFAAAGVRQAVLWRGRGAPNPPLAAFLVVLVAAVPLWETGRVVSMLSRQDTRLAARDWVLDNVPPGTAVAREHYAPPLHSNDGYRIVQFFSLTDQSFELYCDRDVEYLLLSSKNAERYLEDETDRFLDQRQWYERLEDRTRLVRRFEGVEYGVHHPTIEVRRLFCPDAEAR